MRHNTSTQPFSPSRLSVGVAKYHVTWKNPDLPAFRVSHQQLPCSRNAAKSPRKCETRNISLSRPTLGALPAHRPACTAHQPACTAHLPAWPTSLAHRPPTSPHVLPHLRLAVPRVNEGHRAVHRVDHKLLRAWQGGVRGARGTHESAQMHTHWTSAQMDTSALRGGPRR